MKSEYFILFAMICLLISLGFCVADSSYEETFSTSATEINTEYTPARADRAESWSIVVKVDGQRVACPVTKEQYNSFLYGEVVKVSVRKTGIFADRLSCQSIFK